MNDQEVIDLCENYALLKTILDYLETKDKAYIEKIKNIIKIKEQLINELPITQTCSNCGKTNNYSKEDYTGRESTQCKYCRHSLTVTSGVLG